MEKDERINKSSIIELYQPANTNSYTVESLASSIPSIRLIYEHTFRHRNDGDIEIKRTNAYGKELSQAKPSRCAEYFELSDFYRTFGKKSKMIFKLLQKKGYISLDGNRIMVNKKAKLITPESFHLGFSKKEDKDILKKINTVLWRRISMTRDENGYLDPMAESLFAYHGSTVIGEIDGIKNYKFRIGHTILSVEFYQEPAIELLELISLRILLIFQEQLQNFFHASATQNYDNNMWFKNKNKRKLFYNVISTFLYHSWNPFDLHECIILIKSGKGLYNFANGRISYSFDIDGSESVTVDDTTVLDREIIDKNKEFIQYDIDVGVNRERMEPILMTIYLKSRSYYNVDPRTNRLSHHYIKMFIESIGKLIDVIIPIIQKEKTIEALKWKTFYDKLRISSNQIGENISKIINKSVKILTSIYDIKDVVIYSDDPTVLDMITIFRQLENIKEYNYRFRYSVMSKTEIKEGNYITCSLNETANERFLLYVKLPRISEHTNGVYLSGTYLYQRIAEITESVGLHDPSEITEIIADSELFLNLTLTQLEIRVKLISRFPELEIGSVEKAIRKITSIFSNFFDFLDTININLNSSISIMRGSRDSLTGLYNRQTLNKKMESFFNDYQHRGAGFGVLFIDMDSFKIYNDTVNHSFGDKLLVRLAEHLLKGQRDLSYESVPSRFGGDEFCFVINEINGQDFEKKAFSLFTSITHKPLEVVFFIAELQDGGGFEINLLSFLHRFVRPDIGGERGELTNYQEKENESPREHIVNIFIHYLDKGNPGESDMVEILEEALIDEHLSRKITDKIVLTLCNKIKEKIVRNNILNEIDEEFDRIISSFLQLQLENKTTGEIRAELIRSHGIKKLERTLFQRVSIGLSHSSEDRLRSVSSIFKEADARSYMAKQNGKNCVFGLNNKLIEKSYKDEISILIIDDEEEYVKVLQKIMTKKYKWPKIYDFINDVQSDLSYKRLRDIDIIILDLQLYTDDDFKIILAYLKGVSENREIPIIINSGFIDEKAALLERVKKTKGLKVLAVLNKTEEVFAEIDKIISERFNIAI